MQTQIETKNMTLSELSDGELDNVAGGEKTNPVVDALAKKLADKIVETTEKIVNHVVEMLTDRPWLSPPPGSR